MKLPRFYFASTRQWYTLWRQVRRENARLRLELRAWQNLTLKQARLPKLFELPPKPVEQVEQPPVGLIAKRAYLARQTNPNAIPTAEEVFANNGN